MLIDCDTCSVRGKACDGCVVSLLFGDAPPAAGPAGVPDSGGDQVERRAIELLTAAGFEVTVLTREETRPRLRLVPARRRDHHAA